MCFLGFELLHRLAASAVEMAEFVEGEAAEANPAVVEPETTAEGGDEETKPLVSHLNVQVHSSYGMHDVIFVCVSPIGEDSCSIRVFIHASLTFLCICSIRCPYQGLTGRRWRRL